MSKYTTEVRYICETFAGYNESVGGDGVNDVISKARSRIFNFNYPIFDEAYKEVLETKILKHFYFREIGFETVALWKIKLDTKLNEIMPYYNQLYKSELLKFNPLYDVDYTKHYNLKHDGLQEEETATDTTLKGDTKTDTTTNATNSNKELYSDTPQGAIDGLESGRYLTNATINSGSNQNVVDGTETVDQIGTSDMAGKRTVNNIDDYLETVQGKQGMSSYSKLLLEYRQTFLNIDMMVLNDLKDLFMLLW